MSKLLKALIFVALYVVWVIVASSVAFKGRSDPGFVPIIGYMVAIMVPMGLFLWWFAAVPGWVKKVEADGQPAEATILSVKNTGVVINNTVAVVKLRLRVEPPNEAPFEINQEKEISMLTGLGGYTPGAHLRVKYDPANKNHLVILGEGDTASDDHARPSPAHAQASSSGSNVADKLEELSKLHKSGELTDSEYSAAKKKVLG
jgi:Short C-terminal domain